MDLPFPILWKLLVATAGMFWFMHGRRQKDLLHSAGGVALMLLPYFIPNALALVVVALVLGGAAWKWGG